MGSGQFAVGSLQFAVKNIKKLGVGSWEFVVGRLQWAVFSKEYKEVLSGELAVGSWGVGEWWGG